jgi:regulator of sigma E protease
MSWVLTIIGIVLLIILHEVGHFTVAKAVGMRVERFSLFFPPRLFGVKRGETDYMVGAIPAGGYVKITGMTWEEIKNMDLRLAVKAYCVQPPWKRIVVILAGPGMNVLIAFLLFWIVIAAGNNVGAEKLALLNPSIPTLVATTSVQSVERGAPAERVLKRGDRIVTINGRAATAPYIEQVVGADRCAGALANECQAQRPVHLVVRRSGKLVAVTVYPRYNAQVKRMLIGFGFGVEPKDYGVAGAAGVAVRELGQTTAGVVSGLGHALTSAKKRKEVSSIVGITEVTQQAVARGWGFAFVILGFVSLALAVINLFPFLPLDGGHVLWAVAEKVRGRRISMAAMVRFSSVGIVLLLFLVFNGFYNDITRLGA